MIHSDEDDEFERILRENQMKGQPYHYKKREWVGLTEEEQLEIYKQHIMDGWGLFYEAIEAKLKEKNT